MTVSPIRLFCTISDDPVWGDLSFSYFTALRQLGRSMSVLPLSAVFMNVPSRWQPFSDRLAAPVGKQFVNVVCAEGLYLVGLFTIGVPNIAITRTTAHQRTPKELNALRDYSAVICPTMVDVGDLQKHGISAIEVVADPDALARLFSGF